MNTIIETKRLRLHKWTDADEEIFARECNVPEITRWLGGPLSEMQQKNLYNWLVREQQDEYGHTFWPVKAKVTDEFLGICGLVTVDEEDSTVLGATELGYRFKPSAQGKGFGTEAAIACLRYAFEVQKSWRVVSRTIVENAPSWGLMKRILMRHDPRLDYISADGTPFIVHVITISDWMKAHAQRP